MRILTALFLLSLASVVYGQDVRQDPDWCVSGNGNDNNSGTYPNSCKRELNAAISVASDGDIICMNAGGYGGFTVPDKSPPGTPAKGIIIKRCSGKASDADVILEDRNRAGSSIVSITGPNVDISGFYITGDMAEWRQGISTNANYFKTSGSATNLKLHDIEVRGNIQNIINQCNSRAASDPDIEASKCSTPGYAMSINNGSRIAIIASEAAGLHLYNIKTHYYTGSLTSGDLTSALVENNDIRYAPHNLIRLRNVCNNLALYKEGATIRNNIIVGNARSDFIQKNVLDKPGTENPKNPNPFISGSQWKYPCRGVVAILNNIVIAMGEQPVDGKGGTDYLIQGNVFVASLQDSDGPWWCKPQPCEPAKRTWGGTLRGQPFVNILARDNLYIDNGPGFGGKWEGSFEYNATLVNLGRWFTDGPLSNYFAHTGAGNYGGDFGIQNSVIAPNNPGGGGYMEGATADYAFFDGNIWESDSVGWCRIDSGKCTQWFYNIADWRSHLLSRNQSVYKATAQNSIEAPKNEIFVTQNIQNKVQTGDWWDYDVDQVLADLQAGVYDIKDEVLGVNTEDGGQPLALTTQAGTGGRIWVGWASAKFCCRADELSRFNGNVLGDMVIVNGQESRITDMRDMRNQGTNDGAGGWLQLANTSIATSQGDAVDIRYDAGHTSRVIGARGYWRGTDVTDPPPPSRPPPPYQVLSSADDGFEVNTTVSVTGPELIIGETPPGTGSGSLQNRIASDDDDKRKSPSSGWTGGRLEIGTNENIVIFRDLGIPAGATVDSAYIEFVANNSASSVGTVPIYAINDHAPVAPGSGTANPPLDSVGSVAWAIDSGWTVEDVKQTADIATLIQARIDDAGWVEGASDIGLFLDLASVGTPKRLAYDYSSDPAKAALLVVSWTVPATGGDPTDAAVMFPTDIAVGASVSNVSLNFQASASDNDAANWQIYGFVPPTPGLTTAPNNITNRALLANSATCASIPAWTAGEFYTLTDTECPGLSTVVNEIAQSEGFDGRVGFKITGTGTRRATSVDADPADSAGMSADWVIDYNPVCEEVPDQTLLTETQWDYTVACTTPGTSTCPDFTADFSDLPGGNDASITEDPDPQVCEATLSWPTPDRAGAPYTAVVTATDAASGLATQLPINLRVYSATQDSASMKVSGGVCDVEETKGGGLEFESDVLAAYETIILGFCWDDLPIEKGSVVTDAYVQFMAADSDSASATFDIYCEDADDSAPFTVQNPPSARTPTALKSIWTAPPWVVDESTPNQRTAQMRRPIQEVIDRAGWVVNNRLSCFISGNVGAGLRRAWSYDGEESSDIEDPEGAARIGPILNITWAPPGTTSYNPVDSTDTASEDDRGVDTEGDLVIGN